MINAINVVHAALQRFTCPTCRGIGQVSELETNDTLCPACKGAGITFPTAAEEAALDNLFTQAMNTSINTEDNTIVEVEREIQTVIDGILTI